MKYRDLRDFLQQLEARGQLRRIHAEVDPHLEITEICDRTLRAGGPALLFENPRGHTIPVLGNLFGTPERVALGMGEESVTALREVGELLSQLKEPEPPKGMKDAWDKLPVFRKVLDMAPKAVKGAACQNNVIESDAVDLATIPVQTCWPGDAGPDHLGAGGDAWTGQGAAKPRHLSHAGDRSQPRHHALARAPRRRAGLS